jgi:hypothetical protein
MAPEPVVAVDLAFDRGMKRPTASVHPIAGA